MKVAFAILCDDKITSLARKLAIEIDQKFSTGFAGAILPPHISLKQPFPISNMDHLNQVEKYFDTFSKNMTPFEIELTSLNIFDTEPPVLYLEVKQDQGLMDLHLKILKDLRQEFGIESATYEGEKYYHFHCTITCWGKNIDTYRQILEFYRDFKLNYKFKSEFLSMFIYPKENIEPGNYFEFKRIRLT